MNFLENITFRRTRTHSESNDDSSNVVSQTLDCTSNSLPDMSEDDDGEQICILKKEIESLKTKLQSAHEEIDLLSLEKSNLQQSNAELLRKNKTYEAVYNSPAKQRVRTPKKNTNIRLKEKQTQTSDVVSNTQSPPQIDIDTGSSGETQNITTKSCDKNSSCKLSPLVKHKICVISSETSNRIYTMSEDTHLLNYNHMCHYRMPRCGIEHILKNIEDKVRNFTYSDYCIIFIGEEDFKTTNKYIELVTLIRQKLLPLNHTNFIICLPTFKYMDNSNIMFNSRIDTFNNLIYMDVQTYNYAFILDSNLNLPYTHDTYNQWSGILNNKGFNIVISDLQDLILDLATLNTMQQKVDCSQKKQTNMQQNPSQFFL